MWNRKKDEERRIKIAEAIIGATEALASTDRAALREAHDQIIAARMELEPDDAQWDECFATSQALEQRLAQIAHSELTPCPCCGGRELLVARDCSIDSFYVRNAGTALKFTTVVCRACGDLRMRCEDPAALVRQTNMLDQKCFETVEVAVATRPPFR